MINMFYDDHAPPHFHATYAECKGIIDINNLKMIKGNLPRRALELILDWAELHQAKLLENWQLCETKQVPHKIAPLK